MNSHGNETAPTFGGQIINEAKTLDGVVYKASDGFRIELSLRDECVYVWPLWGSLNPWVITFDELESTGHWVDPALVVAAHRQGHISELQSAVDRDFDRFFSEVACG